MRGRRRVRLGRQSRWPMRAHRWPAIKRRLPWSRSGSASCRPDGGAWSRAADAPWREPCRPPSRCVPLGRRSSTPMSASRRRSALRERSRSDREMIPTRRKLAESRAHLGVATTWEVSRETRSVLSLGRRRCGHGLDRVRHRGDRARDQRAQHRHHRARAAEDHGHARHDALRDQGRGRTASARRQASRTSAIQLALSRGNRSTPAARRVALPST